MKKIIASTILIVCVQAGIAQNNNPTLTEQWKPEVPIISPGKTVLDAPSDATLVFDGNNLNHWESTNGTPAKWKIEQGALVAQKGAGSIRTKAGFGNCQIHIEWRTPAIVEGEGQDRGNSGIFIMGRYELQILDSYNNKTYSNGQAAAIYKQHIPLVNVCRPPGEWQTYDIIFTAPIFHEDGRVQQPARVTVLQNGILVQNNVTIWGNTEYIGIAKYEKHSNKEPLLLQDHNNTVAFRNIWIRPI